MKTAWTGLCGILLSLLLAIPLTAERASRESRSGGGRAPEAMNPGAAMPPAARTLGAVTPSSSSGPYNGSPSSPGYTSSPYASPSGIPIYSLKQTSFGSLSSYYSWNAFYGYLYGRYSLNPDYFNRFFRNTEPLITPPLLKLSLRESVDLSSQMLDLIDQLQLMLGDAQAGKTFDKEESLENVKQIRMLAKEIRKNGAISYIDLRKERAIYEKRKSGFDMLGPEALGKLREMAVDLNNQLKNMHNEASTQTVAVDHFSQPSFKSLAKGIEELSKDIEKSIKKSVSG